MATKGDVTRLMGVMVIAWPKFELAEETIQVYYELLKDIPAEILDAGAKHCMASETFFPSISEWRRAAIDVMANRNKIPTAAEAWEEIMIEMNRCGNYWQYLNSPFVRLPKWSHPLIEKIVSVMGYRQMYESENRMADRAHFLRIYADLMDRAMSDAMMLPDVRRAAEEYQAKLESGQAGEVTKSLRMLAGKMGANSSPNSANLEMGETEAENG